MRIKLTTAASLIALTACGHRKPQTGTESVFRYVLQEEPGTLDPQTVESASTTDMLQNVYEGLTITDKNSRPVPGLAEKWDVSPDKKTWTFHLRPNAKFHNPINRAVTAADIKWSYERALRPDTKAPILPAVLVDIVGAKEMIAGKSQNLEGVKVIDPQTLSITVTRPIGYFLGTDAGVPVICREVVEKNGNRIDEKSSVGTGPFMLKEFRHGARVVLVANPDYWGGRPKVDRIERPVVIDPNTAHIKFENNELDFLNDDMKSFVQDQKDLKLAGLCDNVPFASVGYIVMQPELQKEFADLRVRKAFAMAIDRDEIARVAFQGLQPRADGFLPPGALGYNANIRKIAYDPAGARKLMAEAGYPDGKGFPTLTLYYVQKAAEVEAAAQLIRNFLKTNLGVNVNTQAREAATFYSDASTKKLPFWMEGWVSLDPHDYLSILLRTGAKYNSSGFSNPEFDKLCDLGDVEMDEAKRAEFYKKADQIVVDQVALLPYTYSRGFYLRKPWVKDVQYFLNGPLVHYTTRIQH